MPPPPPPLLSTTGLSKHYPLARRGLLGRPAARIAAVSEVDLSLYAGETLGLVGESGCGKSTLARLIGLLYRPDSGTIRFRGHDVTHLPRRRLRAFRRHVQLVFQDPFAALNPRLPIDAILTEPLAIHRLGNRRERHERAGELLRAVGLDPGLHDRYPHEFSGGQRQRIAIARALALSPELIIADEAVSALDVSIQSQILNLLQELKERLGLAYLFISHDLAVIAHLADRVAVMYLGRIVESAPRDELFARPAHPYTGALLAAIPAIQAGGKRRSGIALGDVASPVEPPPGCSYQPRCPRARQRCRSERPTLDPAPDRPAGHRVACHYPMGGTA